VDAAEARALARKLLLHNATRGGCNTGDPRRGRELWAYRDRAAAVVPESSGLLVVHSALACDPR
jgi:hypothetical protein